MVVVLLIGLPGAGKSRVAAALQDRFDLHRVCRDALRAAMFPGCGTGFAEKRAAFRAALLALEIHCALGRSCVLDGVTLARDRDRKRILAMLRRYQAMVVQVHLDCPPAVARQRVAKDLAAGNHPAADRVPEMVEIVASRFDPPPPEALRVDASIDPETVAARVIGLVETAVRQAGVLRRS